MPVASKISAALGGGSPPAARAVGSRASTPIDLSTAASTVARWPSPPSSTGPGTSGSPAENRRSRGGLGRPSRRSRARPAPEEAKLPIGSLMHYLPRTDTGLLGVGLRATVLWREEARSQAQPRL